MAHSFHKLTIVNHPLIQHKLTIMRQKETRTMEFRQLLKEIGLLMGYEVTRDFPTDLQPIETPVCPANAPRITGKKVAIVPILRAGLGMADGIMELMPGARIGHIGLYRDSETKRPVEYLVKLPKAEGRTFFLVDPMLATGYSAAKAVDIVKQQGADGSRIKLICLVAAPEGVQVLQDMHPDVDVYVASLDEKLNENAYIVPGLGDAGDRLYGTK